MRGSLHTLRKIPMKLCEYAIKLVGRFNHRAYMKLYARHLKQIGVDMRGEPIYIAVSASLDGKDYSKIHIGENTVISGDVRILTHDYSISRAILATGRTLKTEAYFLRDVTIGNNSFIGARSILMPGSVIGENVIVGAGSVVRGVVPANSIVMGNPAVVVAKTTEWAEKKLKTGEILYNPD